MEQYHIVYKTAPTVDKRTQITEVIAEGGLEKALEAIKTRIPRSSAVLGIYVTGTPFGDRWDIQPLTDFKRYLETRNGNKNMGEKL